MFIFAPKTPYFVAMKCVLLVRVSTEQQSFDEQEKELFSLALSYGYAEKDIRLVAYKESAIKLSEEERAGLNEMKQLIETGEYDRVFAWEISRIARRKKVLFSILEYLVSRKIQLTIKEPSLNLLKEDGTIDEGAETVFTLYAQLAESEMRNKMARFTRGRMDGYNKGKYMGGKITRGYKVNEHGFWEIDEESAVFIRTVFELYNSGEYSMTELAEEMKSRGYFSNLSITNTKTEIHHMLRNPLYLGIRTSNNIYPQLIDQETWDTCVKRRAANKHKSKRNKHLLTPIIHCKCGASYSVNLIDATYNCRIKHNAVEKGLEHSPSINVNIIESLAWWVALQELAQDMSSKQNSIKEETEAEIDVLKRKIAHSESVIQKIQERRKTLDEQFFVLGRFSKQQYETLTQKQNNSIKVEQENIRRHKRVISQLEKQIVSATTFDELIDSIRNSFDDLKNGADFDTMKTIIHRYIKDITIEPIEGKLVQFWKKVTFKTFFGETNDTKRKELSQKGLDATAMALTNTFYVDVHHHIVYFDEKRQYKVPFVYMLRITRKRVDTRKREKKPIKNKQYD